ncbi:MAG: DUF502 domain-containing protein [Rhabdochlamydiaceae bacterium]|nr:DUF502 domain-containing protein [Rhabdochlamydiaceae bacterium]
MGKIFRRGLIAIAPLALTLALFFWFFNALEGIFSVPLKAMIGTYYFSGLGILVALVLIFCVGIVINSWLIQRCSKVIESLVTKIPLVKTLYNSIGEMMSYFGSKDNQREGQVVLVELAGIRLVGLVTRDSFKDLPEGMGKEGEIAVFLPMSYQIGGYTIFVPKTSVTQLAMTVEEGMRFAVTAGVLAHPKVKSVAKDI